MGQLVHHGVARLREHFLRKFILSLSLLWLQNYHARTNTLLAVSLQHALLEAWVVK